MIFRVPSPGEVTDPAQPDFIAAAGEYVRRVHKIYDQRAHWHRRLYRLSGITVVVAGASLPLLTTLDFAHKNLTISLVGVAVSVFTALRAFYRWDQGWSLLRNTEFEISDAYWEWMAAVQPGPAGVSEPARREATLRLLERIGEIRRGEATVYFRDLPLPERK